MGATSKGEDQKKRQRTKYTKIQLEILEASFLVSRNCSGEDKKKLAKIVGVEEVQVANWFQNRKQRCKKTHPSGEVEHPSTKRPKLSSAEITNTAYSSMVYFPLQSRPSTTFLKHYSTVGGLAFPTSSVPENPFTTTVSNINNTSTALPENSYMPTSSWNHRLPSLPYDRTSQYPGNCIVTDTVTASSENPTRYAPQDFQTTCSFSNSHPKPLTQHVVTPHYFETVDSRNNVAANSFAPVTMPVHYNYHHSFVSPVQGTLMSSFENSTMYSAKNNFHTSSSASAVSSMIISQPGMPQYSPSSSAYNPRSSIVRRPLVPILSTHNIDQPSVFSMKDKFTTTQENAIMHSDKGAYQATCSVSHLSAMFAPQPELPQYSTPFEAYNPATSISGSSRGSVTMPASQNIYPSLEFAAQDAIKTASENFPIFSKENVYHTTAPHSSLMPSRPPQFVRNEDYSVKSGKEFENHYSKIPDFHPCISVSSVKNEIILNQRISSTKLNMDLNSYQDTGSVNTELQSLHRMVNQFDSPKKSLSQIVSPKTSDESYQNSSDQNPVSHNKNVKSPGCDTKNFDNSNPEMNSATELCNQDSEEIFSSEIDKIQSSDSTSAVPPKYSHYLNELNESSNIYTNEFATETNSGASISWQNFHLTPGSPSNSNRRVRNSTVIEHRAMHSNAPNLNEALSTFSEINMSDILDGWYIPNEKVIKTGPLEEYSTETDNDSYLLNYMRSTTNGCDHSERATINMATHSTQFNITPSSSSNSDSYFNRLINAPSLPRGYNHITPNGSFYAVRSESKGSSSN